jgi:hypothetical protein
MALVLKGSVANDPERTLASNSCCSSEAAPSLYQSTRSSRYDAVS